MDAEVMALLCGDIERLVSTVPAGMYVVDADGEVLAANERAEQIWGGPLPNCLTRPDKDAPWYQGRGMDATMDITPEQWPMCRALKERVRIFAEVIDIECFDGRQATIITGAAPLITSSGDVVGAVSVIQDVTGPRQQHRADALLLGVLSALAGSLDLTEVLHRLVNALLEAGDHTRASVMLWHEDRRELELAAVAGEPHGEVGTRIPIARGSSALQRAVDRREQVLADFSQMPAEELGLAGVHGIVRSLIFPLVRGDEFLGLATVDDMREGVDFSPSEVALIGGIASSAALAIENARRYEAEHHIAMTLQQALLALPDRVEHLAIAHAYRSASEAAFVGGDFYDLFEIAHGLVGVLIGDIAGKGLDAAVLTQLVKNTIRAHAAEKGGSPATIMRLTNDILFQVTSPDLFATAFFGVLDRATGRLVYTNAGHTDGIVARASGEVIELEADSPLLGAFAHRTYVQSEVGLAPGDVLLLYTDGVTEARSGQHLYGDERLRRCLQQVTPREPADLVRAIVQDVLGFTGGSLTDDLAILAVQRLEERAECPDRQRLEVVSL